MSETKLPKAQISPTGLTMWPLSEVSSLIWCGTGSRLYLGLNATKPGGQMVPIEYAPCADAYQTRNEAARAALRFIEASEGN